MTDIDSNLLINRAQVYDSFIQVTDGANRLRLKSLQSSEPTFLYPNLDRISDDGQFFLTPEISKSVYNQRLVLTTEEVSTSTDPISAGDITTLSYFLAKKALRDSVKLEISIVYVAKETADNNDVMRLNFTYELESFTTPRINEDGDVFIDTTGRILQVPTPTFIRDSS